MKRVFLTGLIAVAAFASALSAYAQTVDDPYNIMRPEPWLAPKYQSPRGTQKHVRSPRTMPPVVQAYPQAPPPIYVPETGRLLPNLPALPGAGLSGAETGQDRALRCAHQAGVYGQAAGNREAYVGSCINQ